MTDWVFNRKLRPSAAQASIHWLRLHVPRACGDRQKHNTHTNVVTGWRS